MAKIVPLFSSSSGNSYYIRGNGSAILVDAGRNTKQIELALERNALSMQDVCAVFVSHEHTDHISALNVLLKKYRLPLYATRGTLEALIEKNLIPAGIRADVIEDRVEVQGFEVQRVMTSHDARESCGFLIETPDHRTCSIITDTGYLTDDAVRALSHSRLAVVESNHDITMLRQGGYPYPLKQRILSDEGHLSNEACAAALPGFVDSGLTHIILGHLSRENNTVQIALEESARALTAAGMKQNIDYILEAAAPESYGNSMVF